MGKRGREITTTTTRARNEREKAAKTGRAEGNGSEEGRQLQEREELTDYHEGEVEHL
jgi:hypothetical protein